MPSIFIALSAKPSVRVFLAAGLIAGSVAITGPARAQQAGQTGPDFDPVTRAFSNKNPPTDPNAPAAAAQLTPEQQAALEEQKRQAQIQQMREEAKKKHEAAVKAEKEREEAQQKAQQEHMAALKAKRDARLAQMKENREKLKDLLQQEKDARKAYQQAKESSTGSTQQIDDDYRKAEADRQKQIRELRHPKYEPLDDKKSTTGATGLGSNTTTTH